MDAITRKEMFMDAAAKGDVSGLPVPVTREEMYLYIKASGDTTGILEPITRREIFWHAMCTGDASGLPDPVTREEVFLLAAAEGDASGLPDPVTREEMYLKAIAEGGGGGGGGDDGGDKPFDELTWDQVIASTKTGKYKTFTVGATKELDLGSEGIVHMQIVGIDVDDLSDGSGKAPLTFISKELLKTLYRMNPDLAPESAPYDVGTGTIGGWEHCEMRDYLNHTIMALIQESVRKSIKAVTKYSNIYNTSGQKVSNVATADKLWIPSCKEIFGGSNFETEGTHYSDVYPDNGSRIKKVVGEGVAIEWRLRTASDANAARNFRIIDKAGKFSNWWPYTPFGVAVGFCL